MKRGGPLKRTPLNRGTSELKRTPLARKAPISSASANVKPRKRLAPFSARRANEAEQRRAVLELVRRRDGEVCWYKQLVGDTRCAVLGDRQPLEGHEIIPRSAWPGSHLIAENIRMLCPLHHDQITDAVGAFREWCFEVGLRGHAWDRPTDG